MQSDMTTALIESLKGAVWHELYTLKCCTNDILVAAIESDVGGPVNWGDLRCVSAELYIDDDGDCGYRVYIEEASPDAMELRDWVTKRLVESGYSGVGVVG